jgi:hypothetical protein
VVSRVCRNWRRLALDAGLLASTLHQYVSRSSSTRVPPHAQNTTTRASARVRSIKSGNSHA